MYRENVQLVPEHEQETGGREGIAGDRPREILPGTVAVQCEEKEEGDEEGAERLGISQRDSDRRPETDGIQIPQPEFGE